MLSAEIWIVHNVTLLHCTIHHYANNKQPKIVTLALHDLHLEQNRNQGTLRAAIFLSP